MEDTLIEFLQRGASLETDVLSAVKAALPQDLAQQLDNAIPPLPTDGFNGGGGNGGGAWGAGGWSGGASAGAGAVGEAAEETAVGMVYTADAVADNQIGAGARGRGGGRGCVGAGSWERDGCACAAPFTSSAI